MNGKRWIDRLAAATARYAIERDVIALAALDMQAKPIAVAGRGELPIDRRASGERRASASA